MTLPFFSSSLQSLIFFYLNFLSYENITELILKHHTCKMYQNRWAELAAKLPETSSFSEDMTPIVLACQKNLFGIVHLLWQEGMRVPEPHDFGCSCDRCSSELTTQKDQLKRAKKRLNEYRALTSEAYISLTSNDPFQTAFELARQMSKRAAEEKHFKREYKELVGNLSRYVVKLLDCVRTHEELQSILNCPGIDAIDDVYLPFSSSEPLVRLRVAIQHKQKEFVAYWSCQQELMRKWLRGFNQHHGRSGNSRIFLELVCPILHTDSNIHNYGYFCSSY